MKLIFRVSVPLLAAATAFLVTLRAPAPSAAVQSRAGERFREATYAGEAMEWLNRVRAHPTGHIPEDWRERALAQIRSNALTKSGSAAAVPQWVSVGPAAVGGRIRSIAIDPTNSANVYCGSVSGGIWKSTTAGTSWTPISDFANNIVIGCMAIDPSNPNIIYAGTGEGYFNYDYLRGAGVLKSTDGGSNWTLLTSFTGAVSPYFYYYINKILIKPSNTNILYAGMLGGVWKSTNAGVNWSKLNVPSSLSTFCTDLAMDVQHPETLYAAFGLFTANGVWKTTNGGTNWTKLTTGFPATTTNYHRISLAVAPSNPAIIFACLADSNDYTHSIQKSTDYGATWAAVGKPVDLLTGLGHLGSTAGGQGWYNNVITVHPTNPSIVLTGGINLFKSTDGGANWVMKTNWYNQAPYKYMHADQHAIVYDKNNVNIVYFGNDGGMYKSTDGGENFAAINTNLAVTQFYSGAVNPSPAINLLYGGTQDNGTLRSAVLPTWAEVSNGGDGGVVQTGFGADSSYVYLSYTFLGLQRSQAYGAFGTFSPKMSGIPNNTSYTTDRASFIAPFTIDPSDPQVLVAGTFKIYRTTNRGESWASISNSLPANGDVTGDGDGSGQVGSQASTVSAVAIAKSSPTSIYVGTTGSSTVASRILATTNTGTLWINVTTAALPNRSVMSIVVDPADRDRAFAGFSGYNSTTPAGHVFRTTNRGAAWTNASGNLPDVPVNVLLIDPDNANHLFAGTDLGVFETLDAGTNWTQQNTGMANVAVFDLDLRRDSILFAATHGRGMFRTVSGIVAVDDGSPDVPSSMRLDQNYPNPFNPRTIIGYRVAESGHVTLKVYDLSGREVATLVDGVRQPGSYSASFDASGLASGIYLYRITAGGTTDSRRMVLLK